MEGDDPRRTGLAERDVGHDPAAVQDTNATLPPTGEGGYGVHDVGPARDLKDMRAERAGALPRDDDRRLRLILGPGRPSTRPAAGGAAGSFDRTGLEPTGGLVLGSAVVVVGMVVAAAAIGGRSRGVRLLVSSAEVVAAVVVDAVGIAEMEGRDRCGRGDPGIDPSHRHRSVPPPVRQLFSQAQAQPQRGKR